MQLIGEMLDSTVRAYPEREAILFRDEKITYREFNQGVNRLANGLKEPASVRGTR